MRRKDCGREVEKLLGREAQFWMHVRPCSCLASLGFTERSEAVRECSPGEDYAASRISESRHSARRSTRATRIAALRLCASTRPTTGSALYRNERAARAS